MPSTQLEAADLELVASFPYPDKGSIYTFLGQHGCFKALSALATRALSASLQSSEMAKGVRVTKGPDWKWGSQDRVGEGKTPTATARADPHYQL